MTQEGPDQMSGAWLARVWVCTPPALTVGPEEGEAGVAGVGSGSRVLGHGRSAPGSSGAPMAAREAHTATMGILWAGLKAREAFS